jgi:uncharacterized delta-60 repeat protein
VRRGVALPLFVAAALLTAAAALALPGDLDPKFGSGGLVTTDFASTNDEAIAVTTQNAGKLVAAGVTNGDFGLVRYDKNGKVDMSFGTGGKVDTPFSGFAQALAVITLPSDDLVAAGGSGDDFALARYQKNGAFDPAFGVGGKVMTSFTGHAGASAVVRQPDGKLVAAGTDGSAFAFVRYNGDGSLDSTFGSGGKVVTPIGANAGVSALLLQPDGKLVAAGSSSAGGDADFALARYDTDGTLDATFGSGGVVTTDFGGNDHGFDALLQGDGKIVVAGAVDSVGDVALACYNADGSLDSTFGSGGKVTTDLGVDLTRASGVGLDSAGNIVAGGTFFTTPKAFLVLRYTPTGSLDPTFGSGGEAVASFGAGFTEGNALLVQPNDKIVVVGHHGGSLQTLDFALARFDG